MALYSRAEFDDDMELIERLRHQATKQLLAKKISGFRFNAIRDELDRLEERLKGKLRMIRLLLSENEDMRRVTRNCGINGHKCENVALCACGCHAGRAKKA